MIKNSIYKGIMLAYLVILAIPSQTTHAAPQKSVDIQSGANGKTPMQHNTETQDETTMVYIHEIVKTLNKDTDCNPAQWSTPEDACACCLMYNKGKRGNKKSADAIIEQCTKSNKQCTENAIIGVKKQYGLAANASSQDLFDKLEDRILIKNITIDKSLLEPNGAFTESSLPKFLAQAYNEEKLINND